jgi:hypothetical protein
VNIGARSLGSGATITVSTLLATGVFGTGPFTRTYPPNFFEQVSLAQFINNTPIPAGGQVAIIVSSGNVILYGATNDNRTNDPSIKFFTKE